MVLEMKNIKQKYGDKIIISDMNISFNSGIYGLIGPNGAGKSTMMRMISTVEKPASGTIMLDDCDIYNMGEQYRKNIGYAPQKVGYYPEYTAYRFLKYIAKLKDIVDEDQIIEECLKMVDLWDYKDKKIKLFSGGMKQRINIAQALLNSPSIIILDEPTVGLDPNERIRFKNLLVKLSENKIVIFATHIVSDVEDIADKVLVLNKGNIILNEYMDNVLNDVNENVWECRLTDVEQIRQIRNQYKISKVQRHKGYVTLRVVSDVKPCEEAIRIEGSLEEVYLGLIGSVSSFSTRL